MRDGFEEDFALSTLRKIKYEQTSLSPSNIENMISTSRNMYKFV
jgi:hypothetical protein